MRKVLVLMLLISLVFSAQAQESQERALGTFKGIKTSAGIDVYIKKGAKESARVEVSGIPLSAVITEVSGTWLKVQIDRGEWNNRRTVKVYVTYTDINKLSASSASNIFSEGILSSDEIELGAYSAASIEIAIKAKSVNVECGSAGDIVLEGKSENLAAEANSAGKVDAYKLEAENVSVTTNSAGEAKVNVTKSLVATANSGGSIHYRGNPSKTMTNANSGGSVKKSY